MITQCTCDIMPSDLPPLVQAMLKPSFYPHPTMASIRLIQTHISYVLLTGDLVYKVKKPLRVDFLDFSALEKRRFFCNEEVRLNRRGAPGIYLRVDEVRQLGNEFHIGGDGTVVEYLVVMRELPQDCLLSNLAARGALRPEHITTLARRIAAYHASAPTSEHIAQFGNPDAIKKVIDSNYLATKQFIGGPQTEAQFVQTRNFSDGFFVEHRNLLKHRVAAGHIRECHGDLHLRNISLLNEEILLFDCIEFNESFRCIDVIQDASFVAMDLEASGHAELATLLISEYAEQTGDWEGLQLLRLYQCRHAYVRAKVNSMLLGETEIDAHAKQAALVQAMAYYKLAAQYALEGRGRLFLVCGLSGSGKSTISRQLAQTTGAIHIRSDAVRKHLGRIRLDQKGEHSTYTPAMTDQTYRRLIDLGFMLVSQGFTVILDATFERHEFRLSAIARALAAGMPLHILHCTAGRQTLRDRLATRRNDISDATAELLDRQERDFEDFNSDERPYVIEIDTMQPFDPIPYVSSP